MTRVIKVGGRPQIDRLHCPGAIARRTTVAAVAHRSCTAAATRVTRCSALWG